MASERKADAPLYEGQVGEDGDQVIIVCHEATKRIVKRVRNFKADGAKPFSPSYWIRREIDAARFVKGVPGAYAFVSADPDRGELVTEMTPGALSVSAWNKFRPIQMKELNGFMLGGLRALRSIHEAHVIHGDVHPGNMIVPARDGRLQWNELRFIDFAFSLRAPEGESWLSVPSMCVNGVPRFTSPFQTNLCISMRDDIISLVFSAMSVFGDELPWPSDPVDSVEPKIKFLVGDEAHQAKLMGKLPSFMLLFVRTLMASPPVAMPQYAELIRIVTR